MSLGHKLLRNITANYVGVVGRIVLAFLISPFLVHSLGDTKYGIWTIVASLSGYMGLLDLGIAAAITRYVAVHYQKNDHEKINTIISSGAFLFYAIGAGIVLVSPLLSKLMVSFLNFDPDLVDTVFYLIIVVSGDISIFIIAGFVRGALGGFQRFDLINIVRLLSLVYKGVAFYIFVSHGFELIAMGLISVSTNLLVLIISYYQLKKYFPFVQIKRNLVSKTDITKIYHFSKFVFIAMIANHVLFYSDSLVIGYFLNMAAVTYYTIPWSLADHVKQFCLAVSSTYIPLFSELYSADDKASIFKHYIFGTKVILVLSNLFCVGMIVMGAPFIALWMGGFYADKARELIIIFFVTLYFYSPQLISYAFLQALNRHRLYSYLSMVIAALNLILSIILVQEYGLIGVAIGTAIPQIIFFGVLVPFYTARINNWSYISYLYSTHVMLLIPTILLFAGLYGFLVVAYPESYFMLFGESILVSIGYLVAVYFFSLSRDERLQAKSLIARFLPARARKILLKQ